MNIRLVGLTLLWSWSLCGSMSRAQLPTGFINEPYVSGLERPVGLTFDEHGVLYVWEKRGVVQLINQGVKRSTPLLDISEEVGNWRDHGLTGFALDPDYLTNGYIYLLYVVDRHHLLTFGTPAYDPVQNLYFSATIGRITRYTVLNPATPSQASVDLTSRHILVGESISTGIPIVFNTHGVGDLEFGDDGTLLASTGDGASTAEDYGGPMTASYSAQALADGIISSAEDVGVFRPQLVNSLSGKILRIDPTTGEGLTSNPFYDPLHPTAARSRVWALGLRNPFSLAIKPFSGSHDPADGNPGLLCVGEVGFNHWEELNLVVSPGQNFGWPMYEGMATTLEHGGRFATAQVPNLDAPIDGCAQSHYYFYQLFSDYGPGQPPAWPDPCQPGQDIDSSSQQLFLHSKPTLAWIHQTYSRDVSVGNANYADVYTLASDPITGATYDLADSLSPVKGSYEFKGNCSMAGIWYQGNDFPVEYQGLYFHADHDSRWIRTLQFDLNHGLDSMGRFGPENQVGTIIGMAQSDHEDGIFYVDYGGQSVKRIRYAPQGNQQPEAIITLDQHYSPDDSLAVALGSSLSSDPEGAALQATWDFGDGDTASGDSVVHLFVADSGMQSVFTVTLTVTDTGGVSHSSQRHIYLNNTPPTILSTSIDTLDWYPLHDATTVDLTAVATDAETPDDLSFRWQTVLFHEEHNHPEPYDYRDSTQTQIDPLGCDGQFYMVEIRLRVSDSTGLSTDLVKGVYPNCDLPVARQDLGIFFRGGEASLPILANDQAQDGIDSASVVITSPPQHGQALYDATTANILYQHNGMEGDYDTLRYAFTDLEGDLSNEALVVLQRDSAPTLRILSPTSGDTLIGSLVKVEYRLQGKLTDVAGVQFVVDDTLVYRDDALLGFFNVRDLAPGPHRIQANLYDAQRNPLPYASAQREIDLVISCQGEQGTLYLEYWAQIAGGHVSDLTADSRYPEAPTIINGLTSSFTNNDLTSNDGHRLRGYLTTPESGLYTFGVKGGNSFSLYISSDDQPANKRLIAWLDSGTVIPTNANLNDPSFAQDYPTAVSEPVSLTANGRYYVELLQKAGETDGFFNIQWTNPDAAIGHFQTFKPFRPNLIYPWVPCANGTGRFPTVLDSFSVYQAGEEAMLRWQVSQERELRDYVLQRSQDSVSFADMATISPQGNAGGAQTYEVIDPQPWPGKSYYRLMLTSTEGRVVYSATQSLVMKSLTDLPTLHQDLQVRFANPTTVGQPLSIRLEGFRHDSYDVQVYNLLGQIVLQTEVEAHVGGQRIDLPTFSLRAGQYLLRIRQGTQQWTGRVMFR